MPFNPNAGAKIANNPAIGARLMNQGGIGIQPGNVLAQAWPQVKMFDLYRLSVNADGEQNLTVGYEVPWAVHVAWEWWMLGYSTTLPLPQALQQGGGGGQGGQGQGGGQLQNNQVQYYLSRVPPYQCPERPHLYCSQLEVVEAQGAISSDPNMAARDAIGNVLNDGNGNPLNDEWLRYFATDGRATDGMLKYQARFTPRPYEVRSDSEVAALNAVNNQGELERYVERQPRSAVQSLPLPADGPKFAPQLSPANQGDGVMQKGTVPASAAFLLIPTEELLFCWMEIPDDPAANIASVVGCVNANDFDGARGYPVRKAGTLLCQAPLSRVRYRHVTGRWYWRVHYSFLFRATGHQYLPNNHGNMQLVTYDGNVNGKPLYPSADFSLLFVPPAPLAPNAQFPGG
jgi:hypothetical protein